MRWRRRFKAGARAAAAAAFLLLAGCGGADDEFRQETLVFGARGAVTVAGAPADADAAIERVFAEWRDMHARFYPWRAGELRDLNARIAAGELPVTVSASMAAMLRLSRDYAEKSGGLFNPAIGGLVELWGFNAQTPPARPPAAAAIRRWLARAPRMADLRLSGAVVTAAPPAMRLDFGALAKGAALDRARAILRAAGVGDALIELGGGVLAMGTKNGAPWRVALFADRRRPPLAVIALRDGEAVATSGDSERFFVYDGKKYHHILDPRTGAPARETYTAIVISAAAGAAGGVSDAAATALVIADDAAAAGIMDAFNVTLAWRLAGGKSVQTPALRARLRGGGR